MTTKNLSRNPPKKPSNPSPNKIAVEIVCAQQFGLLDGSPDSFEDIAGEFQRQASPQMPIHQR
jgi:hypothetical protein